MRHVSEFIYTDGGSFEEAAKFFNRESAVLLIEGYINKNGTRERIYGVDCQKILELGDGIGQTTQFLEGSRKIQSVRTAVRFAANGFAKLGDLGLHVSSIAVKVRKSGMKLSIVWLKA